MFLECKVDDADNPIKFDKPELLNSLKKNVKFQIEHDNASSQNEAEQNKVNAMTDQQDQMKIVSLLDIFKQG